MSALRRKTVGIIGSGLAGLAAACTLSARGYAVTLFERNDWLGGKAAVWQQAGYRFDMGPTILTLPSVLQRIFAEADRPMEDALELIPLDPQWRCFYSDQTTLDLHANLEAMKAKLHGFSPESVSGYEKFLSLSERLHRISERFYFWKPIGSVLDMMDVKESFQPAMLADLLQMRFHKTVASTVRSFVPDERVAQMLDHFTQYVGSAPDQSPAVLCGIAHMQTGEGVWYPLGGTRAVPVALHQLASELGVEFRTGARVREVKLERQRATGLITADVPLRYFAVAGRQGDLMRAIMTRIEGDLSPQLRILNSQNTPISRESQTRAGETVAFVTLPETGWYLIEASAREGTGSFDIYTSRVAGTTLQVGDAVSGTFTAESPTTSYIVNARLGDLLSFNMFVGEDAQANGAGPELTLLDLSLREIGTATGQRFATLRTTAPRSSPYILQVSNRNPGTTGSFSLRFTNVPQEFAQIPAQNVTYNADYSGTITNNAPLQFYRFSGKVGELVTLSMTAPPGSGLDPYLIL
ncbi:MAG TPA: FAD-dependent oxidoreductase, partial [Gemmatales bacterium]|nr:FAD-dependent oxidoreductase [Gemmatales bacterium]